MAEFKTGDHVVILGSKRDSTHTDWLGLRCVVSKPAFGLGDVDQHDDVWLTPLDDRPDYGHTVDVRARTPFWWPARFLGLCPPDLTNRAAVEAWLDDIVPGTPTERSV